MHKMLQIMPLLFAVFACGGGNVMTSPKEPSLDCSKLQATPSSANVPRGGSVSVSYASNCQSVVATSDHSDVFPNQTLPANGSFTISNATVNLTITLVGKGSSAVNTISTQVAVTVQQPAPVLHITSAADSVVLNHSVKLTVNTQNVQWCTYSTNWKKTGKEFPETIAPSWSGGCSPSFNPGSTLPDSTLHRKVTLKVCGTGYDGSTTVCDSVTVRLVIPKLVADSISPTSQALGTFVNQFFYGHDSTFTTSNGEDFRGTVTGAVAIKSPPPSLSQMITNVGFFQNPNTYAVGSTTGGNMPFDVEVYLANDGRPEAPTGFLFHITSK